MVAMVEIWDILASSGIEIWDILATSIPCDELFFIYDTNPSGTTGSASFIWTWKNIVCL